MRTIIILILTLSILNVQAQQKEDLINLYNDFNKKVEEEEQILDKLDDLNFIRNLGEKRKIVSTYKYRKSHLFSDKFFKLGLVFLLTN